MGKTDVKEFFVKPEDINTPFLDKFMKGKNVKADFTWNDFYYKTIFRINLFGYSFRLMRKVKYG